MTDRIPGLLLGMLEYESELERKMSRKMREGEAGRERRRGECEEGRKDRRAVRERKSCILGGKLKEDIESALKESAWIGGRQLGLVEDRLSSQAILITASPLLNKELQSCT